MDSSQSKILAGMLAVIGFSALAPLAPAGLAAPAAPAKPTPASKPASNPQAQVAAGKAELAKGKLDSAVSILTKATQALGTTPASADAHFTLGKALHARSKKTGNQADMLAAKRALRTAIRTGRGNAVSKQANDFMMANLPKQMLSPKFGEGTELIAARLGLRSRDRGIGDGARPKVFEFYADWCEPCKLLKPVMAKMKEEYGDQVEIASINVDDQNNAAMLEQYDVSPIPTIIFMNPDGQVVGYSIGYSGEKLVLKEMQKLVPTTSATPKS